MCAESPYTPVSGGSSGGSSSPPPPLRVTSCTNTSTGPYRSYTFSFQIMVIVMIVAQLPLKDKSKWDRELSYSSDLGVEFQILPFKCLTCCLVEINVLFLWIVGNLSLGRCRASILYCLINLGGRLKCDKEKW